MSATVVGPETNGRKPETNIAVGESQAGPQLTAELSRKDATVWELATIVANSRDFPSARTPEKAAVRMLAGREMGVGPIASVIGIRVEAGRVSMDATLMAGCIKRSGRYDYRVTEQTETNCVVCFFEIFNGNREVVGESSFSWDDAKKAKLDTKETWRGYPRNMLFARAVSNGARWYCAGIFGGSVYTHEEVGLPVDDEGRIVDGESDGATGGGSDLCTITQRGEIRSLLSQIGSTEAEWCKSMAIKLLDELSAVEAVKATKALQKKAAKVAAAKAAATSESAATEPDRSEPAAIEKPLTTAQQTLQDGFDELQKPSTKSQRFAIIDLVEKILPGTGDEIENERRGMLVAILGKRNVTKISHLNALQANALIENMRAMIKKNEADGDEIPF